ncbi:MAG: hypothetical protein WCO98_08870 [bacterium]
MTTGVKCTTRVWAGCVSEDATPGAVIAGVAGKDAALTGNDVEYDGAVGAIILRPTHRDGIPAMNITDWQASGWQLKDGLLNWQSTAASTLISANQHPAAPWIVCKVIRGNQSAEWQLQWGSGHLLTFSTHRPPFVSINGTIVATLPMNPAEYYNYANAKEICWEVRDFLSDLIISCSAFSRVWNIPGVGGATTGNLRISADGSAYSVALFTMKFPLTGNFYTSSAIANADYAEVLPADNNVQVTPGGGRHKITMTGDGDHTPAVKGWNIFRRPVNVNFTGSWQEISEKLIGGHLDYSLDIGKANLVFKDFPNANRIKISQTMELPDGRIRSIDRPLMTVMDRQKRITNSGTTVRVSAVCQQGWLASKRVGDLPPLCDMPVDEAIAMIAEWAGVKKLKIWQDASGNSMEAGGWWGNRGGDSPMNEYLNAAKDWRGDIPWQVKSDNIWHFIKRLANIYQLRVWFEGDEMQIRRANLAYPTDTTGYSINYGTDLLAAPTGAAITEPDNTAAVMVNYVGNGGTLMPAGDTGAKIVVNCPPDITTADAAASYAGYVKSILQNNGGITMTGRTALWNISPGDAIALTGTGDFIDGEICRAAKVNISLTEPYRTVVEATIPGSNWCSVDDEEITRVLSMPISSPAEINGVICGDQNFNQKYFTIAVSAIAGPDKIK